MIKIFKNFTKKDWSLIIICLAFIILQVWLDLKLPDYMSKITMLVQTTGSTMDEIIESGVKMLGCALGSLASSVVVAIFAARVATNFAANLRERLFDKVQAFSMEEIGSFSTASLITRSTNDISQIQTLVVMGLQAIIKAPIMAVWAIFKIAGKSWQWTASTGVAVIVLLVIVGSCMIFALPKFKKLQQLTDDLNRVTRENLTGISVVRAYNAENYQENKFENANQELTSANLFANRVMAIMSPGIQGIMSGLTLAIYWIGAILIENAAMMDKLNLFSDMVVFSTYAMQVVMAFMMLVMIFIMFPRASVSSKRIMEVLETVPIINDGTVTVAKPGIKGQIEFKNVSFKYPDAEDYVLQNITFTVAQGETVAFIGSTGCGKSTVINLVPRFYDVTEGEVLVDGINVKAYTQYALHNKIGYVSQKAVLFSGTIESNVAYGDNGRNNNLQNNVIDAIYTAQASDFVEASPRRYNSYVAQGGSNYSGGQKQRISIARAMLKDAPIIILDEATSSVDPENEQALLSAIVELTKNKTLISIAHRLSTVQNADQIVVINQGRVVQRGTHQSLISQEGIYRNFLKQKLESAGWAL